MLPLNWQAVGFTFLPNAGGIVAGIVTKPNINTWYETLKRPKWRPPNWAFGPVWTSLYCGMGYASYLTYKHGGGLEGDAKLPLTIYGANLLANWAWSPIFFGCKNIKLALADMVIIDITAVAMAVTFYRINSTAGLLIAPYCLWLGLATALNYCVYRDNKEEIKEN